MPPAAPPQRLLRRPGTPAEPRLRWRLLLMCLPLAGGAGLVVHILAGVSLPLAIGVLAVLAAAAWLVLRRFSARTRRLLRIRSLVGAGAGLVGTIAYDLARYGTVAVFTMSFQPFHVWTVFGEAFVGPALLGLLVLVPLLAMAARAQLLRRSRPGRGRDVVGFVVAA